MNKLTGIEQYVIDIAVGKRKKVGYSQLELAEKLNLSPGFIGQVESTKFDTKFNLNHVNALSVVFECSPKDFFPESPL